MNLHGYKKSHKGMVRNLRYTKTLLEKESDKQYPDIDLKIRLRKKIKRLEAAKTDCKKQIDKLRKMKLKMKVKKR